MEEYKAPALGSFARNAALVTKKKKKKEYNILRSGSNTGNSKKQGSHSDSEADLSVKFSMFSSMVVHSKKKKKPTRIIREDAYYQKDVHFLGLNRI